MAEVQANRAGRIVAAITVLWVLSYVAVGARVWGRCVGRTKLWWDDWLIFLAAAILAPTLAVGLIECHLGAGKHVDAVVQNHPGNIADFLKVIYAGEALYPLVIACIKCSILALYYRIFGVKREIARVCQILMGITVAWGMATSLAVVFECKPIHMAWDPTSTRAECFNVPAYLVSTNVLNVALDVAILITPLFPVWNLNMSASRKILISGIFVLGACETAFSTIRLVAVIDLNLSDVTWNYLPAIIWSAVEMCVGMVCACLPVMAPLVPVCLRGRSDSKKKRYGSSSFGLAEMPQVAANGFARRDFDRLEDGAVLLVTEATPKMKIRLTTDIDVREEDPRTSNAGISRNNSTI